MIFVCKQLTHHAKQPHRVTRLIYFKKDPLEFFFFFFYFFCFVFVCSSVTQYLEAKEYYPYEIALSRGESIFEITAAVVLRCTVHVVYFAYNK